jgi:protein SCO1/2
MNATRVIYMLAALLVALTGVASYMAVSMYMDRGGSGSIISDAGITIGGPFELVDQDGQSVTQDNFAGKPYLLFFGFTHCPDICPTKLAEISIILDELGDRADDLNVLFISVDPERDTPEVLKEYISSFHPQITGLSGSISAIAETAKSHRAYYRKVPLDDGDYTVDHSTVVYLFDGQGQFVSPLNVENDPVVAADRIRQVL